LICQCERGHLWDESEHEKCPYCNPTEFGEFKVSAESDQFINVDPVVVTDISELYQPDTMPLMGVPVMEVPVLEVSNRKYEFTLGRLVCISGSGVGKSYELYNVKNYIAPGNGDESQIIVDTTGKKDIYVIICYDDKTNRFYAYMPPNSKKLCYINDCLLLTPAKLKDGDVIEISEIKSVFRFEVNDIENT